MGNLAAEILRLFEDAAQRLKDAEDTIKDIAHSDDHEQAVGYAEKYLEEHSD